MEQDYILPLERVRGTGIVEEKVIAKLVNLSGNFFIGAYTHIKPNCSLAYCFIGRFCRIEENVKIMMQSPREGIFSNHNFSYAARSPYDKCEYFKSFKPLRFYYENYKFTFIGNDVWIQQNVFIHEGVKIGTGAVIYPNSVVTEDVPEYAIVAGNPAKIIGYKFNKAGIKLVLSTKWWEKDLSKANFENKLNHANYKEVAKKILEANLPKKEYKRFFLNGYTQTKIPNFSDCVVFGPSHIDRWWDKINSKEFKQPNFHIVGFTGLAPYSKQAYNFIEWWTERFDKVIFFVPDFRIGNSRFIGDMKNTDGRFIDKNAISSKIDKQMKSLVTKQLSAIQKKFGKKVKFIYWCLYGRELTNKAEGKYIKNGKYNHPSWNYSEVKRLFPKNTLDIDKFKIDFMDNIDHDTTIHPNTKGYSFLTKTLDKVFKNWK